MKRYFELVLKGMPWSVITLTGIILLVYLPKDEVTILTITIGIFVFVFFAGPLFVILKNRLNKVK